jgi:cytidylate kinase
MEYNRFVDLSKSYLFCQLKRNELARSEGYHPRLLPFITISREAGTGESAITHMLIEELSRIQADDECPWTLYDKDLVKQVIDDYNLRGINGFLPEKKFSDIQTMFEELFGLHPTKREMVLNISRTVLKLADMGNAIIVGRGSFYITRHHTNALHVRLLGSPAKRTKHLVDEYNMSLKQAEEYIHKEDQGRRDYVKKLFGIDLNDPHYYDLVINTDRITPREIVSLISDHVTMLKEKLALIYHSNELTAV